MHLPARKPIFILLETPVLMTLGGRMYRPVNVQFPI